MRKTAIAFALLSALTLFPTFALAQNRTAVGVGTGAVAGAIVGGPVGAAVGGVIGGVIGANTGKGHYRVYRHYRKPVYTSYRNRDQSVRQPTRALPQRRRDLLPLG
jgi:uncharacterized membrane protein